MSYSKFSKSESDELFKIKPQSDELFKIKQESDLLKIKQERER